MPISSIGSYLPVMQEFIAHWTAVNADITPDTVTLQGGYTLATFTADRAAIQAAVTAIETADNTRQAASEDRDLKKGALYVRLSQIRAAVNTLFPASIYSNMLPRLPQFKSVESRFLRPFDDAANLWNRINTDVITGFTPPLKLSGNYTMANFNTDLTALRAAYLASTNAEAVSQQRRSERDVLLPPAKQRMKQYRQAVKFKLSPGNALLANVPALSPPPGATPKPVNLSGDWNAVTLKGDLAWSASPNPNLSHYVVRTSPGPIYHTTAESPVATVPKTQTTLSTDSGLIAPGATALFKVYVVLTTANERGSNTVSVTHPGP